MCKWEFIALGISAYKGSGSKTGQREKLNFDAIATEVLVDPKGISEITSLCVLSRVEARTPDLSTL